jgi:hypothetical protein
MRIQELFAPKTSIILEAINQQVQSNESLLDNPFRMYSESWFETFNQARALLEQGQLVVSNRDHELLATDIGQFAQFKGQSVPLDVIMQEPTTVQEAEYKGKTVQLNKPKRGGSKKYYVYVKDPKTGRVKKISFGSTELSVKIRDPKRRASFAARHRCADTKDKTSARYWACRLPRFAKGLGLAPVSAQWW